MSGPLKLTGNRPIAEYRVASSTQNAQLHELNRILNDISSRLNESSGSSSRGGTSPSLSVDTSKFTLTNTGTSQFLGLAPEAIVATDINFNTFTTDNIVEGSSNLFFTDERAQDATGAMVNATLTYNDTTPSLGINLANANTWTATQTFSSIIVNDNTTLGSSNADTINVVGRFSSELTPATDNTYDLGRTGHEWRDLYIDGTAYLDAVDIDGGSIDNTPIGATTPSTGAFTTLTTTGNATIGASTSTGERLNVHGAIRCTSQSANFSVGGVGALMDMALGTKLIRIGSVTGGDTLSGSEGDVSFLWRNGEKARLTSAGLSITGTLTTTGNVGIGDTTPSFRLDVNTGAAGEQAVAGFGTSAITGGLQVTTDGNLVWRLNALNSRSLVLQTDQTDRIAITGAGAVSVNGNTSITGALSTTQGLTTGSSAQIGSGAGGIELEINGAAGQSRDLSWASAGVHRWTFRTNNVAESGSNAGSNFEVINRNDAGGALSVAVSITRATGNVGIGTTTPQSRLAVDAQTLATAITAVRGASSTQYLALYTDGSGNWIRGLSATNNAKFIIYDSTTDDSNTAPTVGSNGHRFFVRGVEQLSIYASGVVINETGGNFDFRVEGDTDTGLIFADASTDRVGIGTTSPSRKLSVAGDIGATTVVSTGDYYQVTDVHTIDANTGTESLTVNWSNGSVQKAQRGGNFTINTITGPSEYVGNCTLYVYLTSSSITITHPSNMEFLGGPAFVGGFSLETIIYYGFWDGSTFYVTMYNRVSGDKRPS